METEAIAAALDGAIEATKALEAVRGRLRLLTGDDSIDFAILLHYAEHQPEKVDPRIPNLIAALANDPSLEIFNGRMVVWPSVAMRVDYRGLAGWLIQRGAHLGSATAVADLAHYLEVSEIPCVLTLVLSGITVEEPCDLGGGVRLLPWSAVPDSRSKTMVERQALGGLSLRMPTAAIVQEETHPKRHLTQEEYQHSGIQLVPLEDAALQDALLCVGMIGPTAPYALATFLAAPLWVPVTTGGIAMPFPEGWPVQKQWSKTQCSEARALHLAFLKLNKTPRDLLRLAMQRLNRAMRRHLPVDAAIDLGIALEALFLSDMDEERGEPTFRLRLRAARYLGSTAEERETVYDLVGDLYSARSSAVHTGRVSDQIRGRPIGDALAEGYSVAAGAVRRMVVEGVPDWRLVHLG
jgi:hypothetical protein